MTISVSYRFDDAVILVTGAGSGIGAALARHCAREGASVIAVDRAHDNLLRGLDPTRAARSTCGRSTSRTKPPSRA